MMKISNVYETTKVYMIEQVELEITNVCSHKCPYCYNGDIGSTNAPYFSDLNTLCKIADKMAECGAKNLILLGGDPAMYPHIFELLQYIKSSTKMSVTIMSNTLDFKNVTPPQIAKYIDEIQFTLHGETAENHESFCKAKEGTYALVLERLKKYMEQGVVVNIAINIIPNTYNIIYDMVKSMFNQGVNFTTLLLQRIIPCGRALNSNEFNIVKDQISQVFEQLEEIESEFGINTIFEDPFPLCYVNEKYHKYMTGCPEGISRIAVRGDGRVACCSAMDGFNLGNVLYDSYEKFWTESDYFNNLRKATYLSNVKCQNCEYKIQCRGGCPVQYMMSENVGKNFYDKFE